MPGSTAVAITVAATIAVAAASVVLLIRSRRDGSGTPHASLLLLLAAPVSAVLAGAATADPAIEDSGAGFAVAFTAVPLLISAGPVAASRIGRPGPALTWAAALAMLAFVAVFGAGLGFFYLPTAVLVLATAVHSGPSHNRDQQAPRATQGR